MSKVCPLGLCITEDVCPNAPCVDCMRRLGEHMIDEVRIMERQARVAQDKGDHKAYTALDMLLKSLGIAVSNQENVDARDLRAAGLAASGEG